MNTKKLRFIFLSAVMLLLSTVFVSAQEETSEHDAGFNSFSTFFEFTDGENLTVNAEINGIDNAEFICGDAPEAAKNLADRGTKTDVIIVDPPRKGCAPNK